MAEKTLQGALVAFMPTFLIPIPNVIIFQFNPETITHSWTQPESAPSSGPPGSQSNPLAVKGLPGESFSFNLIMDSDDTISRGGAAPAAIAQVSGVYSRLAALEMLLYPTGAFGGGLLASVSVSVSLGSDGFSASVGASGVSKKPVPESQVQTVLFVFGPGRIVPVRVTGLTITEKLFDGLLNPTHAEAQIQLRVLTPDELNYVDEPLKGLANVAYKYSQGLRQALATANLVNAAASILGMLPV